MLGITISVVRGFDEGEKFTTCVILNFLLISEVNIHALANWRSLVQSLFVYTVDPGMLF